MKGFTVPLLTLAFVAGFTVAQQQTQQSQSTSQTSSSRASASSSASSSARSGGQQSASAARGGNASQNGSAAAGGNASKWTVTRPTHAVFYTPNPVGAGNTSATISPSLWEDQKKYFEMLGKEGKLLYAGPWRDSVGAMLILHCDSDQDAQNVADEDPVVKSLLYVANVRSWNVTYIGPWVVQPEKSSQSSGGATRAGGR